MFKSKKNAAYFIAEIGQNHQGEFTIAKDYISKLQATGVDAVKFQMRDNKTLFSQEKLDEPYVSSNSFGATYGEHRNHLELSVDEMQRLRDHSKKLGIDFGVTAFDNTSLRHLIEMEVDFIKVASFDFGNTMLLESIVETGKKFILSVGGSHYDLVDHFINNLIKLSSNFSILHCVSHYPCPIENLNLGRIGYLKKKFPNLQIGLSDHFSGILSGPVGRLAGAEIFEKHVTFNRSQKGSDHSFSLTIEGTRKFIRDINRVDVMMGASEPPDIGSEFVFNKLGKSILAEKEIKKGEVFTAKNLVGKITGEGMPVRLSGKLIGIKSKNDYRIGDHIRFDEI